MTRRRRFASAQIFLHFPEGMRPSRARHPRALRAVRPAARLAHRKHLRRPRHPPPRVQERHRGRRLQRVLPQPPPLAGPHEPGLQGEKLIHNIWLIFHPSKQCSNGIRIIAGASASTGSESEAELFCTSAELFCTSVVADAPGIALASVVTGAPFITGSPVVRYILDRSCCINRRSWLNRSPVFNRSYQ